MTTSPAATDASQAGLSPVDLGSSLRRLSREATSYGTARVDAWIRQLKGLAQPTGATDRAVVEGTKAWATDAGNPLRAALRGAWAGADGATKVRIVLLMVLLTLLAPVLLLLLLLGLLVAALVSKAGGSA